MSSEIFIQPTPNPNALKFILEKKVITEGKVSYKNPGECIDVPLALSLFDLRGVDQLHFFENVITVSKFTFEPWDSLEPSVMTAIENMIETHNPDIEVQRAKTVNRDNLSQELQDIEEIIDNTIRPGLQGDGGDVECLDYKDNTLIIRYQGACGTCPSSTAGTLNAIKGILQEQYNPAIEVYIAPAEL